MANNNKDNWCNGQNLRNYNMNDIPGWSEKQVMELNDTNFGHYINTNGVFSKGLPNAIKKRMFNQFANHQQTQHHQKKDQYYQQMNNLAASKGLINKNFANNLLAIDDTKSSESGFADVIKSNLDQMNRAVNGDKTITAQTVFEIIATSLAYNLFI